MSGWWTSIRSSYSVVHTLQLKLSGDVSQIEQMSKKTFIYHIPAYCGYKTLELLTNHEGWKRGHTVDDTAPDIIIQSEDIRAVRNGLQENESYYLCDKVINVSLASPNSEASSIHDVCEPAHSRWLPVIMNSLVVFCTLSIPACRMPAAGRILLSRHRIIMGDNLS